MTPEDRVSVAGSTVVLECIANGFPKPKITWLRDGLPVVFGSGYSVLGESNLVIESISAVHAGTYTCRAITGGSVKETTATLDVHCKWLQQNLYYVLSSSIEGVQYNMLTFISCLLQSNPD